MNLHYEIIRSKRKTISAEIREDGTLLVRAPFLCPRFYIDKFLHLNEEKIKKKILQVQSFPRRQELTQEEKEKCMERAKELLLPQLELLSKQTGLSYRKVKITGAEKRFGSCNAKNHICLSCFLVLYEEKLIDYVLIHELCHTVHHNHSADFYRLLSSLLPDWKERQKELYKIPLPRVKKEACKQN